MSGLCFRGCASAADCAPVFIRHRRRASAAVRRLPHTAARRAEIVFVRPRDRSGDPETTQPALLGPILRQRDVSPERRVDGARCCENVSAARCRNWLARRVALIAGRPHRLCAPSASETLRASSDKTRADGDFKCTRRTPLHIECASNLLHTRIDSLLDA